MPLKSDVPTLWVKKPKNVTDQLAEQMQALVGLDYQVRLLRERPWASITFSGVRCRFAIAPLWRGSPAISQSCCARLLGHSYDLHGHFVADLVSERPDDDADQTVTIEILAIDDPVA
ncbi:hypothetical protein [Parasphingorhabdus cellanae]|uniref:Uncharacterized protein n=1 Tax=Parasphingorhabdus cellanae TaxID=2806553 RepID=A0ABX7T110_9SPHN|nr:hypothetical protein [Parasphingorhabdus cellanae]QTD55239.1 hypothetical protein J4G78_13560 [Parasphingorhabdus cellanae]